MKSNEEIRLCGRVIIAAEGSDGGRGYIPGLDHKKPGRGAKVVWSRGCGWDHVSVSWENRVPTWDEMCTVKNIFFHNDEVCVQYHPKEDEYVNFHQYCLHLFRPTDVNLPTPPSWMIGPKKGQTKSEAIEEATRYMAAYENRPGA